AVHRRRPRAGRGQPVGAFPGDQRRALPRARASAAPPRAVAGAGGRAQGAVRRDVGDRAHGAAGDPRQARAARLHLQVPPARARAARRPQRLMGSVALLWLRRDLRVTDHPALAAARESADSLVPVFCFDPALLEGRHRSGPRTQFLLECLRDLEGSLRELGSRLVIREGPPERELPALARELGAREVHVTADVGPYARRRDRTVRDALREVDCELVFHPGLFAVDDPAAIRTGQGRPYTVFTPYHRAWSQAPRRELIGKSRALPAPPSKLRAGRIPSL